jgi:hypothetical protein
MLRYNGYKTENNIKYVKTNNKNIARSLEFLDGDKVHIKYLNNDSKFKFSEIMALEDSFNWIS